MGYISHLIYHMGNVHKRALREHSGRMKKSVMVEPKTTWKIHIPMVPMNNDLYMRIRTLK